MWVRLLVLRFGFGVVERGVEKWESGGDLLVGWAVEKFEGILGGF